MTPESVKTRSVCCEVDQQGVIVTLWYKTMKRVKKVAAPNHFLPCFPLWVIGIPHTAQITYWFHVLPCAYLLWFIRVCLFMFAYWWASQLPVGVCFVCCICYSLFALEPWVCDLLNDKAMIKTICCTHNSQSPILLCSYVCARQRMPTDNSNEKRLNLEYIISCYQSVLRGELLRNI